MKYLASVFFCLLMPAVGLCISVKEIGRLAELKTADDLIFEIIHKEELDRPINAKDVIYLKERGLSEKVIDYLWKQSLQDKEFLPAQDGESTMIGENLRSYTGTDRSGKKVLVLTNLDENGRRMGPPPPPRLESQPQPEIAYVPQQPQEIYVTVRQEQPAWAFQEEDARTYQPQPFDIPIYDTYYPLYNVISYYPTVTPHRNPHCSPGGYGHRAIYQPQRVNVHGPVQWPGMSGKSAKSRN